MFLGFENYRDIDVLKGKTLVEVREAIMTQTMLCFSKPLMENFTL